MVMMIVMIMSLMLFAFLISTFVKRFWTFRKKCYISLPIIYFYYYTDGDDTDDDDDGDDDD